MMRLFTNQYVSRQKLLQDPYVVATAALIVLASIPLASPVLSSAFWIHTYPYYFDTPILALTALTLWNARRASTDKQSGRFWSYLAVGFLFWLSIRLGGPLLTVDSPTATLATDLVYLAFYLVLILAFQIRPHLRWRDTSASPIQQLESTGATLFGFGLLIYFVVIPATYHPSSLYTNIPSAMLYVVLNFYLFTRALALRRSGKHDPWRGCYNWLALATAGFVLLDGFDLATRINSGLNAAVQGTLLEAFWLLPLLAFVVAARLYTLSAGELRSAVPTEDSDDLVWKWRGKLTYFALVPPLIHIALEILGWSDERTRTPREILVLFWIFAAAALSVVYDRRLLSRQLALEQRHRQVHQQLEVAQRMEAVRRMAGGIAHDFNNLLMVIRGFADVLLTRLSNSEDRSDAEQISRAAERAGTLTRNLLAIGRNETIGIQSFLANEVVTAMTRTLQQQTGARLELELNETGYVIGDQGAFEDAVLNLVLNARDAISANGSIKIQTGKIVVASDDLLADTLGPGTYGYVAVEDNGKGMDEETRRHIFEPFFSKRKGGTGLGLSMAYSFAHEAGGTVEVNSKFGEGSCFRIILPAGQPPQTTMPVENVATAADNQNLKVLLVEDEDAVRDMLKQSLENAGFKVLEASDGQDALRVLHEAEDEIDVVLTDVVMPNMDGGTLARHLQERDKTLPVIFMTGQSAGQLDQLEDCSRDTCILRKPFAANQLVLEIERSIRITT